MGWGCETAASERYEACAEPSGVEALERARQLMAGGRDEAAVEQLRLSLAACPNRVRTHLLYVEEVRKLAGTPVGDRAAAEMQEFYRVADDQRSPVWPYMHACLAEHDAIREDFLEEAIERDDRFHWAYLSLARLWRGHGRSSRALTELDKALEAYPGFPEARLELAEVLAELGRYEQAAEEYANYLRQRPGDRAVLPHYCRLLIYELGRTNTARPIVQSRLDDDPDSVDALMDMAAIAWQDGDFTGAVARYREVLRLDEHQELAVLNLGNLHYDVLWGASPEVTKRDSWEQARKAYRYYLEMTRDRTQDRYDFWDHHFAVPSRLREIDELLGPDTGPAPQLGDF